MRKDVITLLLCIVCSVAVNLLVLLIVLQHTPTPESGDTQTATQTVTINEPAAAPEPDKVNINTATVAELQTLPGIGPVIAEAIIEARPYADPYELMDVDGIGYKIMQNIIDKVEV